MADVLSDTNLRLVLTVPEAAGELGIGLTTAWILVHRGDLGSVRIGRAVRVPYTELVAYIERLLADQAQG